MPATHTCSRAQAMETGAPRSRGWSMPFGSGMAVAQVKCRAGQRSSAAARPFPHLSSHLHFPKWLLVTKPRLQNPQMKPITSILGQWGASPNVLLGQQESGYRSRSHVFVAWMPGSPTQRAHMHRVTAPRLDWKEDGRQRWGMRKVRLCLYLPCLGHIGPVATRTNGYTFLVTAGWCLLSAA
jgi:hypothetical protein